MERPRLVANGDMPGAPLIALRDDEQTWSWLNAPYAFASITESVHQLRAS